jgi:hypothetical protein
MMPGRSERAFCRFVLDPFLLPVSTKERWPFSGPHTRSLYRAPSARDGSLGTRFGQSTAALAQRELHTQRRVLPAARGPLVAVVTSAAKDVVVVVV